MRLTLEGKVNEEGDLVLLLGRRVNSAEQAKVVVRLDRVVVVGYQIGERIRDIA